MEPQVTRVMWNLLPLVHGLAKRLGQRPPRALQDVASRTWEIAPRETFKPSAATFLPGQLDRVTGWEFANEHPRREMLGEFEVTHAPTRGFLIQDAWLIDGVLYKDDACAHLHPRTKRWPELRVEQTIERAAVYCTPGGNKYFGQWLMDDCVTYPLAVAEGIPVTTAQPVNPHTMAYEDWLGMRPARVHSAYLRELVIFEDFGQNQSKRNRFAAMGEKLRSHVEVKPHPGIFVLRGRTGQRRLLRNELQLAEHLYARRGFRILDPAKTDVPTIVATCAGARTIVGIEGSGLIHGILLLPPGGAVVTLQPPNRFVSVYKHLTDRDGQHFGFVVGTPQGDSFHIDPDELERTLDLMPRSAQIPAG
jgi:hypothetical protein